MFLSTVLLSYTQQNTSEYIVHHPVSLNEKASHNLILIIPGGS